MLEILLELVVCVTIQLNTKGTRANIVCECKYIYFYIKVEEQQKACQTSTKVAGRAHCMIN
jgi:hypothetical protein